MENIINSTANASHFNVLRWLDSMLRKAASKVPSPSNKLKLVAFYNINHLKSTLINHFRQLTDFLKLIVGRAFPCLEGGRMAEWLRPADCEVLTLKLRGINYQFAHLVFQKSPYGTSRWFQSRP